MRPIFLFIILSLSIGKINAMKNDHINGDTLTLKGRIVKETMENKRGQKLEGVQDLYFSTTSGSFYVKPNAKFLYKDLEALELKEITIKCVKKFGNIDIDSEDPSYAQTRVGEYISIIEIIKQ
jgi:hypothetical protein